MNRRGFFKSLAAATVGFCILPPATTYERIWKATKFPFVIPPPIPWNPMLYKGEWQWVSSMDSWLDKVKPGEYPRGAGMTTIIKP